VSGVANTATLPGSQAPEEEVTTVNDVVATNIAANVASTTNLSVAPSVASLAISTQIESELPNSDDSSISKPSIIQVSAAGRNIVSYTVQAGDTADTLAAKYNISKDTLKWANNMLSDALTVGQVLQILPRDGIVYTVKSGDTIQGLADKYKSDASTITTYNDLEISGITAGLKIVIPGGILPTNERPGYSAPVSTGGGYYAGFRAGSVGNRYAFGNCTWYAYERRAAMGRPAGSFWGNGGSWGYSAAASGYRVNNVPEAGAILVEVGNPGHVGVVESVAANGDIVISEMNNRAYGGFNIVNNRSITAGQAAGYTYVH
jgi:surface antigen